jgi:MoaA/NifB/PqqE/SkfB family radical SAM enzyme
MLIDSHGRKVSYLRLSITDRCNLRCLYCRPQAEWTFLPHSEILSFEEMAELVDVAMLAGVEKIRLTGGEPFARKDFIPFVGRLHAKYPDLDLRITTNGTMLSGRVAELRDAGISCLNVSLDTLQREKFQEITGVDGYEQVRAGIDACSGRWAQGQGQRRGPERHQRRRVARVRGLRPHPRGGRAIYRVHAHRLPVALEPGQLLAGRGDHRRSGETRAP